MGAAHYRIIGDCVDIFQDSNKDKACVNMHANPRRASRFHMFFLFTSPKPLQRFGGLYARRTAAQRAKTNRGFTVFARYSFCSKPERAFLAIRKERQEMKFPIIITTRKRWREMEGRARRAESAVDGLAHSVDDLRGRLSSMTGIVDDLRRDVRSLRRIVNKKERIWQSIGK